MSTRRTTSGAAWPSVGSGSSTAPGGKGRFRHPPLTALPGPVEAGFVRAEVLEDLVVADTLDDALAGLADLVGTRLPDKLRP